MRTSFAELLADADRSAVGAFTCYDDNVAFVRRATRLAAARGAGVECELGGITGDEDVARRWRPVP